MNAAEDRFIAGDGPLAALIRAQPAFDAPPRMLEHVLVALDAAPAPTGFDSPAGLFDKIMAEAKRIDSAQTPRRDALLAELAAGASAEHALGAKVSPATAAWLAAQHPTPAVAIPPRGRHWPWLAGISTAVTAALAVSVALRVVQESATPPPMPAAPSATAPAESGANIAGIANTTDLAIASAPKPPEAAKRLAKTEAPSTTLARTRSSLAQQQEARASAPAAPAAEPSRLAEPPRAAPTRSARVHAEADAAAPAAPISVPLDTPPDTLSARLMAQPAHAWTLTVAPPDEAAGKALAATLAAQLKAAGRDDEITLVTGPVAPGTARITPADQPD